MSETPVAELAKIGGDDVEFFKLPQEKYLAKIVDIYDGDTVTAVLHEFGRFYRFKTRIRGTDAPEMRVSATNERREELKKMAYDARNRLAELLTNCEKCTGMVSTKDFKKLISKNTRVLEMHIYNFDLYGRLLVDFNIDGRWVSEIMIAEGHSKSYDGGHKSDW
jgi:endonuclease YncB( thermonuclease family)